MAKEIYNIRESKNALLRGQADNMPSDGAQLKIMLDNLNAQEEAMTQMFSKNRAHAIVMIVMYLDCFMIYLFRISHLH